MDPISIIYLLISSGLFTQLIKYGLGFLNANPSSKYTPLIAAIVGAVNDALIVSPEGTVGNAAANPMALLQSLMEGGVAGGLAATGAHQMIFAKNYIKKDDAKLGGTHGLFPFLLPLFFAASLSSCSWLKSDEAKQQFDFRVTTDEGCQSLVILSTALGDKREVLKPLGREAERSYLALQTLIQVMGMKCKA